MSDTLVTATIGGPNLESPYLTVEEAAKYLRFPSVHWFRISAKKLGIPVIRRGRRMFYTKQALDAFMATRETDPTPPSTRRRGKGRKAG